MEISEDKLEKLVEKKVEERLKQREEDEKSSEDEKETKRLNRRQFLKMAGLGAGAIGLSSATSAWSILQPSNQGTSDIDATTLQGNTPSALTGPWEKITSTKNINSGSSVSMIWNTSTTPDYDTFKVIFDFSFDTAGAKLYFQLQEDSSGSWTENYVRSRVDRKDVGDNASETYIESNNQHATLATNLGASSLDYAKGEITINGIRGSSSQWGYYSKSTCADNNDYGYLKAEASGYGSSNNTYSGIRFVTSSGEFARGNVALYGIKI
ncbi:MAG: hypothetical protein ACI9LV_000720 [Candidatus Nanohaloarchaea archaeon]|jgi:hypothetical protein